MKDGQFLKKELQRIDGRGYKAYKEIEGVYHFDQYILSIDYVQGDPFASPSKVRVIVSQKNAQFPQHLFDKPYKKMAVGDYLTRMFARNIYKFYQKVSGSGKSGLLTVGYFGQEILERTSIMIDHQKVEARLEIGLPANGRKIMAKSAMIMIFEALPKIIEHTLFYHQLDRLALKKHVELVEDQHYIREELKKKDLIAFIANDAILPRESGISDKPMKESAIPFKSPKTLEVEMNLPNKGLIKGMGIPKGITLIVGGGFHGKSTLLKALERGVYNHIAGDGREYVITRGNAVKIRAEDGRRVEKVNISPFINHLPNGQNTQQFSTDNASGSTSQAANIMEALEIGTDVLLIDEDTSATNFMIRDGRMQKLVHKNKEPITPFIDKVRQLYHDYGVSTVLVVGGSGDYFDVADTVIMMDAYVPKDVTKEAKEIARSTRNFREIQSTDKFGDISQRVVLSSSFQESRKGIKIKAKGLHSISYNNAINLDLNHLEQLVDSNQTNCIAVMLKYMIRNLIDNHRTMIEIIEMLYTTIDDKGLDEISSFTGHPGNLSLPRKYELAAALNRFRGLRVK